MSAEIKSYLDDAIKNLVTKSDIDSLKSFIEEQSALIKNLTEKVSTLDEKLNGSEASTEKLNDKITNLEGKLAYFESQDDWKIRLKNSDSKFFKSLEELERLLLLEIQ